MVTGGQHSNRFAVSSGRFGVLASREEQWCTYFSVGSVELTYPVAPLDYNVWVHYVIAWDGTVLRSYMNGVLVNAVEPKEQARRCASHGRAIQLSIRCLDLLSEIYPLAGSAQTHPGGSEEIR